MMSNASSIKVRTRVGKYDERGRYLWVSDCRSICRIDSPKLSRCVSAAARSFFFNLSFFGVDDLWIARGTIKTGNGAKPAGSGDGGKTRASTPLRARQREQGKGRPAARQSRPDNSGRDGSKEGFS